MNQSGDANPFGSDSPFNRFFGELPDLPQGHQVITGEGSGFFISADGYAATNYHVADHAKSGQVTTHDGSIYTARVIGTDPKTDLALIESTATRTFPSSRSPINHRGSGIGSWLSGIHSDSAAP